MYVWTKSDSKLNLNKALSDYGISFRKFTGWEHNLLQTNLCKIPCPIKRSKSTIQNSTILKFFFVKKKHSEITLSSDYSSKGRLSWSTIDCSPYLPDYGGVTRYT